MKKSLISVAVLAALSATQVNAGGPHYSKGVFDATCVKIDGSDEYVNVRLHQRGKSFNFLVTGLESVTDKEACEMSDDFLTKQDIRFEAEEEVEDEVEGEAEDEAEDEVEGEAEDEAEDEVEDEVEDEAEDEGEEEEEDGV